MNHLNAFRNPRLNLNVVKVYLGIFYPADDGNTTGIR